MFEIDIDSFSSGQIGSKLWLCQEAEKLFETVNQVWIYGGWYGLTAFLLKSSAVPSKCMCDVFDPI